MKKTFAFLMACLSLFVCNSFAQERPSYIAVEANSGKLLFSSNAEAKRPIASLAQVATAIVALDWVSRTKMPLDTFIPVPQEAFGIRAGNPMELAPGDSLSLRDALYSTLLGSDNVSALAIASFVGRDLSARRGGGSPISLFVDEMNNLARSIRMSKTNFVAPHGMDSQKNVSESCAVDMVLLGMYSMQNPAFCYIVSQASRRITVQSQTKGNAMYDITNNNTMISTAGVDGIKAGSSRAAGPCLLLSATRNAVSLRDPRTGTESIFPQRIVLAILGTAERYTMAKQMLNSGWQIWERWQAAGMDMKDPREFVQLPIKNNTKR
jgi:D-alanyl-D-alanine carboxypeptidase